MFQFATLNYQRVFVFVSDRDFHWDTTYQRWGCVHPCSSRPPDVSFQDIPGLVNIQKAIEHGPVEIVDFPWFSHETWWCSIVFCMFTRPGILGLTCFSQLKLRLALFLRFLPAMLRTYCIRYQDVTRAMSDIISVHDWGLCAKSHSQNSDLFSFFFFSVCRSHRKSKHPRIELDLAWTRTRFCTTRSPKRPTVPHTNGWTVDDPYADKLKLKLMSIPKHLLKFAPACILAY